MGEMNIPGLIAMIVFYLLILAVGILAAWFKTRRASRRISGENEKQGTETVIVADRDIGIFIGIFTMTATWVGGGYINGTAEQVFKKGILWAQAPIGYALSLVIGGFAFAGPMRRARYLTMLDPFQNKYGRRIGGVLYIPALCGELFWTAAILNALGSAVSVILHLDFTISVIASACVAVAYTFFGGLYAVAYTDVVQLTCIFIGLIPCIPYALKNEYVHIDLKNASRVYTIVNNNSHSLTTVVAKDFWGNIGSDEIGKYIDDYLLLICGGMPWQVYFQRVLASKSVRKAQILSLLAAIATACCGALAASFGFIARFTDWETAGYPQAYSKPQTVLPALIQYVTNPVVGFLGLGAISAAVMSSSDSSILSASSMFAHNIYNMILRQKASQSEIVWVIRLGIVFCGVIACVIGILAESVYSLWYLSSDLVYVLLFPQLCLVVYVPWINSYGVLSGFVSGVVYRILLGESIFNLSPVIDLGTNYPQKTIAMLINLLTTIIISILFRFIFKVCKVSLKFDILNAFRDEKLAKKIDWHELWTTTNSVRRMPSSKHRQMDSMPPTFSNYDHLEQTNFKFRTTHINNEPQTDV